MRTKKHWMTAAALLLVALVAMIGFHPAMAQKKLQSSPGGYHGELDFPISWKRYYSYAEWTRMRRCLSSTGTMAGSRAS